MRTPPVRSITYTHRLKFAMAAVWLILPQVTASAFVPVFQVNSASPLNEPALLNCTFVSAPAAAPPIAPHATPFALDSKRFKLLLYRMRP